MAVAIGDLLDGKYRLIRLIGEGGWGSVYEGENIRTKRHVAIKVLRPSATMSPEVLRRFEHEAQAASHIDSPHIVEVYDLGELGDGTHYLVMEMLNGEDLAVFLTRTGALEPSLAVRLLTQVLDGLGAAHEAGILHRDLKPENLFVLMTKSGAPFMKILDFGVSKFNLAGSEPVSQMTRTGAVIGSPYYMAPEQARGSKNLDARTDLYAMGVVLYEILTNQVPFEGDNFNELMFKIVLEARPDPRVARPDLDPELAGIVRKAIACDPAERFQSAAEFRAALVAWLEQRGVSHVVQPPKPRQLTPGPEPKVKAAASWEGATLPTPELQAPPSAAATARSAVITANKSADADPNKPQTPVSLAATSRPGNERKPMLAMVAGAALVFVGVGLFFALRRGPTEAPKPVPATELAPTTTLPTPTAPASATATQLGTADPKPAAVAEPSVQGEAAQAAGSAKPSSVTPQATATGRQQSGGRSGGHASGSGNTSTTPASSATATRPVASATDPKPTATTPDTVQGRTIRTGL